MPRAPMCLLGPRHVHPGVNTETDYRARQLEAIRKGRTAYPNLDWPDPWLYLGQKPDVFVSGGMWQVHCTCGNCPSVSPEWRLALCYECGAIYERLDIPRFIADIERLLVIRPRMSTRNWLPRETIADLERENAEHGIAVGAA